MAKSSGREAEERGCTVDARGAGSLYRREQHKTPRWRSLAVRLAVRFACSGRRALRLGVRRCCVSTALAGQMGATARSRCRSAKSRCRETATANGGPLPARRRSSRHSSVPRDGDLCQIAATRRGRSRPGPEHILVQPSLPGVDGGQRPARLACPTTIRCSRSKARSRSPTDRSAPSVSARYVAQLPSEPVADARRLATKASSSRPA